MRSLSTTFPLLRSSSPHSFQCLRSLQPHPLSPLLQVRSKKKMAKGPQVVRVRLRRAVAGYGPKGAIVPVVRGRMRNDWLPRQIADYVPDGELKALGIEKIMVERMYTYQPGQWVGREGEAARKVKSGKDEEDRSAVVLPAVAPARALQLIQALVPETIELRRQTIDKPDSSESSSALALYGSVSKADIIAEIKSRLEDDEEGVLVAVETNDIDLTEREEDGTKVDRLKSTGMFIVDIRVKDSIVRKKVLVKAEE